jgi:hypothetical protein
VEKLWFRGQKELQTTMIKNKNNYKDDFDDQLDKGERENIARWKRWYKENYRLATSIFLATRNIKGFQGLFKLSDIKELYIDTYVSIGMRFAKFSVFKFQDAFPNSFKVDGYDDIWRKNFAEVGLKVSEVRGGLVQGSAKKTLEDTLRRLISDPEFQALNEREAGRILQSKFDGYADYQARRVVRTESINGANYGIWRTNSDMYGSENLMKEWISAGDGRVRDAHKDANGKTAEWDSKFYVGGEELMFPGSGAKAENNINCRCRIIPIHKEDFNTN